MAKRALSVTLADSNLLWLRGRMAVRGNRSLSETIDEILTDARFGGHGADAPRSVVGTIDVAADDPNLEHADALVQGLFDDSLARPIVVREGRAPYARARARRPGTPRRG